jgi:hypothetical protein
MEGNRARERAKRTDALAAKKKADLGDLTILGNVELRRSKLTKVEKRSKTGIDKVLSYALYERGLSSGVPVRRRQDIANKTLPKRSKAKKSRHLEEATLEYGKPLSSGGASYLAKKTKERKEEMEKKMREGNEREIRKQKQRKLA